MQKSFGQFGSAVIIGIKITLIKNLCGTGRFMIKELYAEII